MNALLFLVSVQIRLEKGPRTIYLFNCLLPFFNYYYFFFFYNDERFFSLIAETWPRGVCANC